MSNCNVSLYLSRPIQFDSSPELCFGEDSLKRNETECDSHREPICAHISLFRLIVSITEKTICIKEGPNTNTDMNRLKVLKLFSRSYTSKAELDKIIRVDHAGELGADRIYAGQMAILGGTKNGPLIKHMWDQEKRHRETFEELIRKHRVRPTAMTPIWNVAGFVLGAGSALLGEKAAMACTVAVETVIVEHYNDQLRTLMEDPKVNKELLETITKFRDEEQEHHDTGIDHGAEQAPFYKAYSEAIKLGCKAAIAISKRV